MKALIVLLFRLYIFILILRVVLTWFNLSPEAYPPVKLIHRLTEPVLEPLRRLLNGKIGFDLSPLLAIILIWLLVKILLEIF